VKALDFILTNGWKPVINLLCCAITNWSNLATSYRKNSVARYCEHYRNRKIFIETNNYISKHYDSTCSKSCKARSTEVIIIEYTNTLTVNECCCWLDLCYYSIHVSFTTVICSFFCCCLQTVGNCVWAFLWWCVDRVIDREHRH